MNTAESTTPIQISANELRRWCSEALEKSGVASEHAQITGDALVQTSLWGIDSHGISRLPHYLNRIAQGSINPAPNIVFTRAAAAVGSVDGDHGLGIVTSHQAMDHALELAREAGIGAVGVRRSSHCGAIGLYARQASRANMIGIGFTHSDSFVVPYGGKRAFFGTNPISISMPSKNPEEPLCLDMATSIVSWNRIMNARRENKTVPPGWGVDTEGNDTIDPHLIRAVKPMADYKGFALAFLIDMLCGPLNGMPYGSHIPKMYEDLDRHRNLGSFFIAIDFKRFGCGEHLPDIVTQAIGDIKKEGSAILFPGEPEYASEKQRNRTGIPVEPGLLAELKNWAQRLGIPAPVSQ